MASTVPASSADLPGGDPNGAFCRANHVALAPTGHGLLDGRSFAVKDVLHVAGTCTGFGQPDWLRTHSPAQTTAPAVARLLAAGARLVGRTISDELTYSLTGENVHYGTPANPRCPDRVPGGSSSGSASAVAGALVDIALGTDCAGSVRLPASYCGILGARPTHGRVSLEGALPFAPSFDTVGWFARDAALLDAAGRVLLDGADEGSSPPRRLLVARDALALVEPAVAEAVRPGVARIAEHFGATTEVTVSADGLPEWMECFRTIQGAEIWASLGAWVEATRPNLGPGIADRIAWASRVSPAQVSAARTRRTDIVRRLDDLVQPGDVLCLPTAPRAAPRKGLAASTIEVAYRNQAIALLCIAGLGGLPQISLPLASVEGCPLGISLVAPRRTDRSLFALARGIMAE